MRVTHRVSRTGLVLSLSVILSGCAASLHQVSLEERRAIQEKKKAIVLLRLTATLNEKEMSPLADERNLIPIRFGLANLDIGEPVRKFTTTSSELLFSLSSEGAYGGWAALAIDPGNYYSGFSRPLRHGTA